MGFPVSTQPTYLYQSPSGYIFRIRIPDDIKPIVGRVEFRYSLRAGALRVAKYRARRIASFIQQLIEKVRKKMDEFTPEQVVKMVKKFVDEVVNGDASASPRIIVNGEFMRKLFFTRANVKFLHSLKQ